MAKRPDAEAFVAVMQNPERQDTAEHAENVGQGRSSDSARPRGRLSPVRRDVAKPSRADLKHFGGYLDEITLEKIAVLRVRLKKDNSELIKLAIDDLHRKQSAKRAFGDS